MVKNLVDPIKSQDVKYRTLKLDNAKLQAKLWNVPHVRTDLLEAICGFVQVDGTMILLDPPSQFTMQSILKPFLDSIGLALNQLTNTNSTTTTNTFAIATNKKPKLESQSSSLSSSSSSSLEPKLSEKQKAKRLLEEKQRLEREQARVDRQRQLELLKQDKLTRETDPNWKPGLSAACAKSGTSISTFRDKYGEN